MRTIEEVVTDIRLGNFCFTDEVKGIGIDDLCNEILEIHKAEARPKGKWITQDVHNCHTDFKCSECGYIHNFMHLYGEPTADYTFCPNCGADMRGEQE